MLTIEVKLILLFIFLLITFILFAEDVNWFFHSGESVWEEIKSVDWNSIRSPK